MVPPPNGVHQWIVDSLFALLREYGLKRGLGMLLTNHGVQDPVLGMQNYRVPEWIFLRKDREHLLDLEASCIAHPPDVVLEVRSPEDETDEKLPFYGRIGVGEVLIVDRDSRVPEIHRNSGARLEHVPPDADGWIHSGLLAAAFRVGMAAGKPVLVVRLELEGTTHQI